MPMIMHQGKNFSGWSETAVSNNYGIFVDFNKVIQEEVVFRTTDQTYTATEDCAIVTTLTCSSGTSWVKVNEVEVYRINIGSGTEMGTTVIFVKSGDEVILHSNYSSGDSVYTVYGIKGSSNPIYGTNVEANPESIPTDVLDTIRIDDTIYQVAGEGGGKSLAPTPFIYSEDEEQVGIWVDGKPLYQKTIYPTSQVTLNNNDWTTIPWNAEPTDIDHLVDSEITQNDQVPNIYSTVRFFWTDNHIKGASLSTEGFPVVSINTYTKVTFRYTKTTDVAWQGGFKAYGFSPIIYSEEEREVGVWKDSKPLYQKSITFTTASNTSYTSINHNIDDVDDIMIIYDASFVISDNNSYFQMMPYWSSVNTTEIRGFVNRTTLDYRVGSELQNKTAIITFCYTKTTDVAGSGKYTTLATPAVHYDNNEKVIGTFFGNTLYEKSYRVTTIESTTITLDTLSGINEIVSFNGGFKRYVTNQNVWHNIASRSEGNTYNTYGMYLNWNDSNNTLSVSFGGYAAAEIKEIVVTIQYTKT